MLRFQDVNDGFDYFVDHFACADNLDVQNGESRNGDVMFLDEPVMWSFSYPTRRVLFNQARNANPFFHVYEAMWMLAGMNRVEPLEFYNSKMRDFAQENGVIWDAYGYRWRNHFDTDQLKSVIACLRAHPNTRRVVLSMWDPVDDLAEVEFNPSAPAIPCNTHIYFTGLNGYLSMTICNRSNDLIWGAMGANAVHFSFLLEYVALLTNLKVGYMRTMSNNLHVYKWNWYPLKWLTNDTPNMYVDGFNPKPFIRHTELLRIDKHILQFVDNPTAENGCRFLNNTAKPMMIAFDFHKKREYDEALVWCERIEADDWRFVAMHWLKKRERNWNTDDK